MQVYTGNSITAQNVLGTLRFYHRQPFHLCVQTTLTSEEETIRFYTAQHCAILQLAELYDRAVPEVGRQAASIFAIHAMLLEDDTFLERVLSCIEEDHTTAEYATRVAERKLSAAFAAMETPYMQARGADIRDISRRIIRHLLGQGSPDPLGARTGILVADELLPSEIMTLDRKRLQGVITWNGSSESHTAILLKLLNIPGLAQVKLQPKTDGHPALLDGFRQCLYLDPDQQVLNEHGLGFEPASSLCLATT